MIVFLFWVIGINLDCNCWVSLFLILLMRVMDLMSYGWIIEVFIFLLNFFIYYFPLIILTINVKKKKIECTMAIP